MHIGVKVEGGEKLRRSLDALSRVQINAAVSEGLNITANHMAKAMKNEIRSVFDRPTSYIVNSIWVERAAPDKLRAWVAPTYMGTRRGNDIDPQKILRAQEVGGRRYDKRIEVALKQANLLPTGMQIAAPADRYGGPLEGSTDGRGNLRGPYLRKLLAYLKTGWQDVAGAKKGRGRALLKRYEWQSNRRTQRVLKLMDGMEFFVSDGKGRSGLGAGIWARKGRALHCVVAFISQADYRNPRLSLERIRRQSEFDGKAAKWIRGRIYEAAKRVGLSSQG